MADYYLPSVAKECAHAGCPNWAEDGSDLCYGHAWSAEHTGMSYDPFRDYPASPTFDQDRNPDVEARRSRTVKMRFPTSAHEERRSSSNARSSGMGRGEHQGPPPDYELCSVCGTPHVASDGQREEIEVFDKDGRRSTAYKPVECPNKAQHERRGLPLKRDWPGGYPTIYDAPEYKADSGGFEEFDEEAPSREEWFAPEETEEFEEPLEEEW